jgi:hypothetical protein
VDTKNRFFVGILGFSQAGQGMAEGAAADGDRHRPFAKESAAVDAQANAEPLTQ